MIAKSALNHPGVTLGENCEIADFVIMDSSSGGYPKRRT